MPMDIAGMQDKVTGFVVDHGVALSWLASVLGRNAEGGAGTANGDIIGEFQIYFGLNSPATQGALYELNQSFMSTTQLKWKLLDSPHLPTAIFKVSVGIWALGKLTGWIPAQYTKLAGKAAIGSGIAALTLPGSVPYENTPQQSYPRMPQTAIAPMGMNYTIQG